MIALEHGATDMTISKTESEKMIDACMNGPIQWAHHTSVEWQFYIGDHTRRIWDTLNFNQKLAIAMDAHETRLLAIANKIMEEI